MTVGDVTFRHPDLVGATDAVITALDRLAIASPDSGKVVQLRMDRATSRIRIEVSTPVLDPPPSFVQRRFDELYAMAAWSGQANGTLYRFAINLPFSPLTKIEDPEMGGALYTTEDLAVLLHGRTKETGMLVARDPVTLAEIDSIVIGVVPDRIFVDISEPNTIYILNNDSIEVRVCTWTPSTSKLALVRVFNLPRGERVLDIMSVNGLMFYVTQENFCVFDSGHELLVTSYHDYYQQFQSVTAISTVIDVSARYLRRIDNAKRSVDRSRQFRDPAFRRHMFGHFQQLLGTNQSPFFAASTAKPQSIIRRSDSRNFVFEPTTGTLTWAAAQTFRYRGWSGNSDAENMADDDVTVVGPRRSLNRDRRLPGEQVSYDVSAGNRLLWTGTGSWRLIPGDVFENRAAYFDGATAFTADTEVVAATGNILSILAWIQPTSGTPATNQMTVIAGALGLDTGWELRITGTTISLWKDHQLYLTSPVANLYDGAWHQVGAILDATSVYTVMDGVISAPTVIPAPVVPTAPDSAFFLGLIADIQVYTDARDSAYISDLFAKGPRG